MIPTFSEETMQRFADLRRALTDFDGVAVGDAIERLELHVLRLEARYEEARGTRNALIQQLGKRASGDVA